MRRKLATLAVVALVAACGFPGVTYENSGDGGGDEGTDAPVSAEGSSGGDGTTESGASSGGDASEAGDATSTGDAEASSDSGTDASGDSSVVDAPSDAVEEKSGESGTDAPVDAPADAHDAGVDAPPVCDFDGDGYKVENVVACGTGTDCCDTDSKAHPGQTTYYPSEDACGSYDYNCNGTIDPEYPSNLTCGGTGVTGCTGGSGFISTNPGCGNLALYGECVPNGLLACQPGNESMVTQGCH